MTMLQDLMLLCLVLIEYATFTYVIARKELKRYDRRQIYGFIILGIITISVSFAKLDRTEIYLAGVFLSIFGCYILFKDTMIGHIKTIFVAFLTLNILEAIVIYLLMISVSNNEKMNAMLCAGIMIIMFLSYYLVIGKKLDKTGFHLQNTVWLFITCMMSLLVGMITYFTYILSELYESKHSIGLILNTLGGVIIVVIIYAMVYYFNTMQKYENERNLLEAYNEHQKYYFEELLKREQDTKQFRHDITAHLLQIQNFARAGKIEEEEQYLTELLSEISIVNKKLYCVGNDIVDTILNAYLRPFHEKNNVKVNGMMGNDLEISNKDLCIVMYNLIKNAIEEVERCNIEKQKEIIFEVNQGKNFLAIRMKNTMGNKKVIIENEMPLTQKKDKRLHGIGIKNIRLVAEKYHGKYTYHIENGYYVAEVKLQMKPFND